MIYGRSPLRAAFLTLCMAAPASAIEVSGKPRIIDGDTVAIGSEVIRLHGIDAPESGQSCIRPGGRVWNCGEAATEALRRIIGGGTLRCRRADTDRYGRTIGVCEAGGRDVNAALVAGGWAVAYRRYSEDYVRDEAQARTARRGVWSGSFDRPEDHRAGRSASATPTAAPDPACPIKGNVSGSGRIYHLPGSRDYARTRIDPDRGERWFCSAREAEAAGWRAPRG
jgi:endonuclease YncB( thermonuclease family)